MNQLHLLGRLTADPELKVTPSGVSYCRFRIAVERNFAKENEIKADFFNVVAWNKQAEFVASYFQKGKPIIVHGEIRNSDYIDPKTGIKHYGVEVLTNKLEFTLSDKKSEQDPANQEIPPPQEQAPTNREMSPPPESGAENQYQSAPDYEELPEDFPN